MPWTPAVSYRSQDASYWDRQSLMADTFKKDVGEATLGCDHVALVYSRTSPTGTREDRMSINLHIAKVVGGGLYSYTAIPAEFATMETSLTTLGTALSASMSAASTLVEFRWHRVTADAYKTYVAKQTLGDKQLRADVLGPAHRVTAKSIVGGSAAGRNADQVSASVTFRTASRRHWGRVYIPTPSRAVIDTTYGRFSNPYVDEISAALRACINSLSTAGYELGVWSPTGRAFMTITEVRADDVPDIIRRRRPKQRNYSKSYTA